MGHRPLPPSLRTAGWGLLRSVCGVSLRFGHVNLRQHTAAECDGGVAIEAAASPFAKPQAKPQSEMETKQQRGQREVL